MGANVLASNKCDRTPLHLASWMGKRDVVDLLLEQDVCDQKVNVNVADKYGCTLLHYAAQGGHSEITENLLKKGGNIGAVCNRGETPLDIASRCGHSDLV